MGNRKHQLKYRYGLTPETWDLILKNQGGGCAVCGREPDEGERFHVDHDRGCCAGRKSCGDCVRGIVCFACNRMLGALERRDISRVLNYIGFV